MTTDSLLSARNGAQRVARKARHTGFQLAAERYQRNHPGVPWMPQSTVEILDDMLLKTDRCLEWGSGASTTWFADRCASILSVEHDPEWYQRVRAELTEHGRDPDSVRLLSLEPTSRPAESPYVRAVDEFADGELDVCFVDAEHRPTCMLEAMPKLKTGGVLILDDVQGYIDHPSRSTYSREGLGPLNDEWRAVTEALADWRLIWTTDRYADCAIWVKP
jgi:predicted O-methyltransferase YrrM